jgi:hypothetical protein
MIEKATTMPKIPVGENVRIDNIGHRHAMNGLWEVALFSATIFLPLAITA